MSETNDKRRLIRGKHIAPQIAEALGLDPRTVRRIVLDLNVGIVMAYVELYGDNRLIEINWAGGLSDTKVVFADNKKVSSDGNV
jgi:hypothetical protein